MWAWIITNSDIPTIIPENFSEAARILFRKLATCSRLYKKSQENYGIVQDMLYSIAFYIGEIEKKFWPKMNIEELGVFQTLKTVISDKLTKIVEGKPVLWGDGESLLLICLDIWNRMDQPSSVPDITHKIWWRIVQTASGQYII